MAMQSTSDVPILISSENSSSERRVSPSWTIGQLKVKLEPVTGIPPSSQRITLRIANQQEIAIEATDEEQTQLFKFPIARYAELHVSDTRPPGARPNYTDVSGVEKYVMSTEEYEKKTDSVLAWKKAQKLGRFQPDAESLESQKIKSFQNEIDTRGIVVGKRCRVGGDDSRRGEIMYVGEIPEIQGSLGAWIGVRLDEPVGKNDGSVGGKRYWGSQGEPKHGVFIRPERVEIGEWPVVDDLEDMEEI